MNDLWQFNTGPGATTVTLAPVSPSYTAGQTVTFTATVSSNVNSTVPQGSVQFVNGSTVLGSSTVDARGQATFSTSSLSPGNYSVVARFISSTNEWATSTSSTADSFTVVSQSSPASPPSPPPAPIASGGNSEGFVFPFSKIDYIEDKWLGIAQGVFQTFVALEQDAAAQFARYVESQPLLKSAFELEADLIRRIDVYFCAVVQTEERIFDEILQAIARYEAAARNQGK